MALCQSRFTASVIFALLLCSVTAAGQSPVQQQRTVQKQWQQLIQQLEEANAKIAERQGAFGERGYDETKDAIKALLQLVKITDPGEDPVDPSHWFEFSQKIGELVQWYTKTLDDIGDSTEEIGALEAKLGTVNQRLSEGKVAIQDQVDALKDIENRIENPDITLQPTPMPRVPDWTALDTAIENMRREDQRFLTGEDSQLQANGAVTDILQRARQRQDNLSTVENVVREMNADLDAQIASAQTVAQALAAQQATGIKIRIPADWVPCTCPDQHVGAGIIVDGVQYHTPLLHCQ
jgi:DNA repair exonuclease SbcCD ATPase subunit